VIYFDTSALVKLVFDETESTALAEWLTVRADVPKVSSDLSTIELLRTCRRVDEDAVEGANLLLAPSCLAQPVHLGLQWDRFTHPNHGPS
jgi:predicted nucleic acid-binding protein